MPDTLRDQNRARGRERNVEADHHAHSHIAARKRGGKRDQICRLWLVERFCVERVALPVLCHKASGRPEDCGRVVEKVVAGRVDHVDNEPHGRVRGRAGHAAEDRGVRKVGVTARHDHA
eukprot:Amastigsp_a680280_28.p3 type:complete len:119 gc:universal Amastigsp_a680280_28:701-345(-)